MGTGVEWHLKFRKSLSQLPFLSLSPGGHEDHPVKCSLTRDFPFEYAWNHSRL